MRRHPPRPALEDSIVLLTDEDDERSIPARFRQQVDRDPTALVMKAGDRSWTYGEVDRRSNQIAHEVLRRGASEPGPEPDDLAAITRKLGGG